MTGSGALLSLFSLVASHVQGPLQLKKKDRTLPVAERRSGRRKSRHTHSKALLFRCEDP